MICFLFSYTRSWLYFKVHQCRCSHHEHIKCYFFLLYLKVAKYPSFPLSNEGSKWHWVGYSSVESIQFQNVLNIKQWTTGFLFIFIFYLAVGW